MEGRSVEGQEYEGGGQPRAQRLGKTPHLLWGELPEDVQLLFHLLSIPGGDRHNPMPLLVVVDIRDDSVEHVKVPVVLRIWFAAVRIQVEHTVKATDKRGVMTPGTVGQTLPVPH